MGKNNNYKKKNNNQRTKDNQKKAPAKKNIYAKLAMPSDVSANVEQEIMDVIKATPFNKISFPLTAYKADVDSSYTENDNRTSVIGYIRDFDPEKNEFKLFVFQNMTDIIESFSQLFIVPDVSVFNDELGTIKKLIVFDMQKYMETPSEDTASDAAAETEGDAEPAGSVWGWTDTATDQSQAEVEASDNVAVTDEVAVSTDETDNKEPTKTIAVASVVQSDDVEA